MTHDEQLKLQAWLDGELSESERQACEARWTHDPQAQALLAQLRHVQATLKQFDESQLRLPESREFYWSRIARALESQASSTAVPAGTGLSPWAWLAQWKRWLAPAALLASLAAVLTLTLPSPGQPDYPEMHLSLADSHATTYRDDAQRLTLVWFTYPAEP
jgi:anti-sigma factor RsiW